MKTKIILFLVVITLFFGCSSPSKKMQTSFNSANNEGMIVGSICIEKKMYNIFSFYYSDDLPSVNNYPNESNSFTYKNSIGDFNENGNVYYLFSIVRPKGKYKFFKIKIFNNMRNDPSVIVIPVDMKFEIKPGETTYFGELKVNTRKKEYTVSNQLERDKLWFAKKKPEIQL